MQADNAQQIEQQHAVAASSASVAGIAG